MPIRAVLLPLLLLSLVFAVSSCGGGDSDEDQISDAISTSATTTSDENCTELQTARFTQQLEFASSEQEAVESCKEGDDSGDAESVEVSDVEVDGDKATANVAVTGSAFDGQTLVISLVKDGDQWKLDHLDDIVDFDPARFGEAFAAAAQEGENALTPRQAQCVEENFASGEASRVEEAVLSGDPNQLAPAFAGC